MTTKLRLRTIFELLSKEARSATSLNYLRTSVNSLKILATPIKVPTHVAKLTSVESSLVVVAIGRIVVAVGRLVVASPVPVVASRSSTASLEATATAASGVEVAAHPEGLLVHLPLDLPVGSPRVAPGAVGNVAGDLVEEGLGLVVVGLRLGSLAVFLDFAIFDFLLVFGVSVRSSAFLLLLVVQRNFLRRRTTHVVG